MCAADHRPSPGSSAIAAIPGSYEGLAGLYANWRSELFLTDTTAAMIAGLPTDAAVAVDVGCGPGLISEALAQRVGHLVAFDASFSMVLATRRRLAAAGADNVSLVIADASMPPFRGGSIDLVVAFYLLHLTDVERTLPALAAIVRPSGTLFVVDSITRGAKLRRSAIGWLWQAFIWPTRVLLAGHARQAGKLVRMLSSPHWYRIHRQTGYIGSRFAEACRRHLPGCVIDLYKTQVKVCWRSDAASTPAE